MKFFLIWISLFVAFTNILFAEGQNIQKQEKKIKIKDEKPIYDILNTYWDICDYNLKFATSKTQNKEAVYDMILLLKNDDIKTAINELGDCSIPVSKYNNYKKQIDVTRKLKITDVSYDSNLDMIKVSYLLYAFQHPEYRLSNGKEINTDLQKPIGMRFKIVEFDGKPNWLIAGGTNQEEINNAMANIVNSIAESMEKRAKRREILWDLLDDVY